MYIEQPFLTWGQGMNFMGVRKIARKVGGGGGGIYKFIFVNL